ncbi:MAG: DUF5060 domain-containing protein [Planctomycetota bacterium]|jgi:hypothetical protein|nr:DUF5060 domain-containing protein [Planctomycetota bacterium]
MTSVNTVGKWDIFEIAVPGPSGNNPYLNVELQAVFSFFSREVTVPGFYDGDGAYRIRFMPDREGEWTYRTRSNAAELNGKSGSFICAEANSGNRGPVRVRNRHHFAYADGEPYFPFGTTCYAWTHQPLDMQKQTLDTLKTAGFNKIRMCVFPKHYIYNANPPLHDVYARIDDETLDFDRPNFAAFRHFETQIGELAKLGIEADVILFHPYDRWGYCAMSREQDYRYLKYVAARLAAHRNVWWSLANEFDFILDAKPMEHWDRCFQVVEENDPYGHPKSIHNGDPEISYNHRKPWVDHVCVQNSEVKKADEWRSVWGKPVVNDELEYEGDIPRPWGNIGARELVHRFWMMVMRGCYAGHGETYMHRDDLLWWAKGGELRGESWKRIKFLRELVEADVKNGLTPLTRADNRAFSRIFAAYDDGVRFIYFGEHQPRQWAIGLPMDDGDYDLSLIDIWNMTVTPLEKAPLPVSPALRQTGGKVMGGAPEAAFGVILPGEPYLAVRIRDRKARRGADQFRGGERLWLRSASTT